MKESKKLVALIIIVVLNFFIVHFYICLAFNVNCKWLKHKHIVFKKKLLLLPSRPTI